MLLKIINSFIAHFLSVISTEAIFSPKRIIRNSFIIHFLSFMLISKRAKYKRKSIISFNAHFLSFKAFRNKIHRRRRNIDSFITHFYSNLIAIWDKLLCMYKIINSFTTHLLIFVTVRNRL